MTWQRYTVPGSPLPVPYPDVVGRLASSSPLERRGLIPGLLGDVAAHAYSKLLGTAPLAYVEVTARIDQLPRRDSRVRLGTSRDALGQRRLELDWQLSELDRESAVRALESMGSAVGAAGIGRMRLLIDRDGPWPDDLRGGWHQMGTTRMSDDPRRGVVDRDCRVHGVLNLFVAGSSVFPTSGSGTPTLTLAALALRLAKHLRRELA
jgi:choline dehydrogenase-like flavoprotein